MAFAFAAAFAGLAQSSYVVNHPPPGPMVLGTGDTPYRLARAFPYLRTGQDPAQIDPRRLGPFEEASTFVPFSGSSALGGNTIVFRLRVSEIPAEHPDDWVFRGAKAIPTMVLYVQQPDGGYRSIVTGMSVPYADRPFPAIDPVLPIPHEALDGRSMYLAVRAVNEQRLPVIVRARDVLEAESSRLSQASLFAGFFLAFALSSLLVFVSVRSRASLHYAALMFGGFCLVLTGQGWPWKFLWPALSVNWRAVTLCILFFDFVATVNFARVFLSLPRRFPRIDRMLRIAFWITTAAWVLYGFAPNSIPVQGLTLLATNGLFFVMLAAALIALERGVASARYAVLAFAGICAACAIGVPAMTSGRTMLLGSAEWIIACGIAWHALILSLGLAEHLSRVDRERAYLTNKNKSLESLVARDAVTGIPNRRAFDERLVHEWRRALRNGRDLAILMVDIDHFKGYNDAFGHVAGDECLRSIASTLEGCMLRSGDFVARFGGEEFVAVVPDITLAEAQSLAELMRKRTADLGLTLSEQNGGCVTISVGVAAGAATAISDPLQIVQLADEALYAAKTAGRDRTVARAFAVA